jgi:class 3 adenylate cyclase/tetratricopeptide (TPR) repeat protein
VSAVVPICPSCGRESAEGFRFCPHCGSPLDAAPAVAPRTERKVVTVLFCDLVGFTTRSDRADPEDVRAILRPFHELARSEIERYGGTLDKFIGDAAMGVFGSPATHEDDPERAVRAALGILERLQELRHDRAGEPTTVRIGVNTGEAVVTLAAGVQAGENVAGDVVNTASRLQAAAPAGAVIVGEATYRATRDAVRYEELEPVTAKGKAEPLPVWRAVAIRALPTISDRAATTPFVGRARERALLEGTFLRAVAGPQAQLVTIVGEPGVGKSRLVAELRSALPRLSPGARVQWLRGRCLPYGDGITFWALGEIVKDRAGILESDPPEERDRKLRGVLDPLVADHGDRAWLRARLAALVGGEGAAPVERAESFAAWLRFIEAVAGEAPLVVVFEDLHWADPALLSFIEHLAGQAGPVPLLLLATTRPELYDRHSAWGTGIRNAVTATLDPLSGEETGVLVTSLLDAGAISDETRTLLLERSGGNPLYAEEFAHALQDRGLVDDQGRLTGNPPDLQFPETVQALIAARLDTLAASRKRVLQDASVIGRVFWAGAVAFLADANEDTMLRDLAELSGKEFVQRLANSSFRDEVEFAFWHAIVRDVAYAQLPRAERAKRHRRAAAWIERAAGERLGDLAEILAHHATSALELARAAGETDDASDLEGAAARYLRLAGARTMALDAEKAERQLTQALDLTPPGHPERSPLLALLAEAAFQAGRLEEADRAFDEAITGLRRAGRLREAADSMVRRSVVLEYRGEVAAGRTLLSDAVELLRELPPGPELARAFATSAGSLMISGRYQETIREADRAIQLADAAGESTASARAHGFRGYSRATQGDIGGLEEQRSALERLRTSGLGRATAVAYNNLGSCLLHLEGTRPALEVFRDAVAFAETRGLRESVMALQDSMLTVLFEVGDWDEVLRLGQDVVEEARRQGSGHDEVYAEADRAVVLAYRQGPQARDVCESVLERARPLLDPPLVVLAILAAGIARAASGDRAGTAALLREAHALTTGDSLVDRAPHLPELARLAVAAGDPVLAEELLDGTEELVLERYRLARAAARASIEEAVGELDAALVSFERVAEEWARWGNAPERAHALFGAGRCLTRLGRSEEARGRLEEAAGLFEQLGSAPTLAAVRAFLD